MFAPAMQAFRAMIQGIVNSTRSKRDLMILATFMTAQGSIFSSLEVYFVRFDLSTLNIAKLNVLDYPGIFEEEERREVFSRQVKFAEKTHGRSSQSFLEV